MNGARDDADWLAAELTPAIRADLRAAVTLLRRHRPAGLVFRLSVGRDGELRLRLEHLEGLNLAALLRSPVSSDRGIDEPRRSDSP